MNTKTKKATLQDVADLAGVSKAAVSMVLRDHPKSHTFSEATLVKVREAANDLKYRANFFASQLRRNAAQMVMLCVDSLQNLYSSAIAESFQQRAAMRGYWTTASIRSQVNFNSFDSQIIGSHGISAIAIVANAADHFKPSLLKKLIRDNVRIIFVGRDTEVANISKVLVDDHRGGYLAAEHIYKLGAKRVWLLTGGPSKNESRYQREQGVIDYAQQNNLTEPESIIIPGAMTPLEIGHAAYEVVKDKLKKSPVPDAIIANLDLRAFGVYQALNEQGLQVGKDVAVIGYDDIWASQFVTPKLTTIHQPTTELGETSADLLIDALEGKVRPGRTIQVAPELVIRDSTLK